VIANTNRDPKTRPQPFEPSDFFPSLHEPKPDQTPEEQIAVIECWAAVLGG
jgi:hypothetical protein